MPDTFLKDPDSVLDYKFYWADKDAGTNVADDNGWLQGDTISTSTVTVSTGITLDSDTNDTLTATAWLSGGSPGSSYTVTNRIVTAAGRTVDRTITIKVLER